MGNSSNKNMKIPLDYERYRNSRPKLSDQDIYEIYRGFQVYKPIDNVIETEELIKRFGNSNETIILKR